MERQRTGSSVRQKMGREPHGRGMPQIPGAAAMAWRRIPTGHPVHDAQRTHSTNRHDTRQKSAGRIHAAAGPDSTLCNSASSNQSRAVPFELACAAIDTGYTTARGQAVARPRHHRAAERHLSPCYTDGVGATFRRGSQSSVWPDSVSPGMDEGGQWTGAHSLRTAS